MFRQRLLRLPRALLAAPLTGLCLVAAALLAPAGSALAQSGPAAGSAAASSRPAWSELSAAQREALQPLAAQWGTLSEPHKRKWIALAANFHRLPPAEQAKLHSRMSDWIALSPAQRAQARLNFGEAQQLPADEKKAKWEAYQALPPEEKRRFAASAVSKPPATAAATRPVPSDKLASVPRTPPAPPAAAGKPPRIVVGAPAETAAAPAVPAAPAAPAN